MDTYLIQRGKFNDRDFKKGIDSIVQFDYMGSTEYESDALPGSLDRIRKDISFYTYIDVPIQGKVITVFCKDSQKTEVKLYLEKIAAGEMRTKEWHAFDDFIKGDEFFSSRVNHWWDIENDLMFWEKNVDFETKFKSIIEKKPE
jgi:hypothetical protein